MPSDWNWTPFARVVDSSLRIILVAAMIALILLIVRVRSSAVRHSAWTAVLCAMILMPILPYCIPSITIPIPMSPAYIDAPAVIPEAGPRVPVAEDQVALSPDLGASSTPALGVTGPTDPTPVWPTLMLISYSAGLILLASRLTVGWHSMSRLRKASRPIALDAYMQPTSPSRRISILESDRIATPVTVGVVSAGIILPAGWRLWSEDKLLNFLRCLAKTLPLILLVVCCSDSLTLPASQVNLSQALSSREREIYANARTTVDLSFDELTRTYPRECADLVFDDNQEELPALLRQVADTVATLVRDIPNTASKEQVRREKLRNNLTVDTSSTQTYNYLVLPGMSGLWDEVRTDSKGRSVGFGDTQDAYFMTSGFAGLALFFHPGSLSSSRFRLLGRQRSEPKAYLIAFAQRPDGEPAARLQTPYMLTAASIMYQGLAWVDPRTYQILRMRTDLLAPRWDVYLARQTTEIWYADVHFASNAQAFWLPREVLVTLEWKGQAYRNRHLYSDYLVFSVESQDKLMQPRIKK